MSKLCDVTPYTHRITTLGTAAGAVVLTSAAAQFTPTPFLAAAPVLIALIALHLAYHPMPRGARRGVMIGGLLLSDSALLLLGLHAALTSSVTFAAPISIGTLLMHALLVRTLTPAAQRVH